MIKKSFLALAFVLFAAWFSVNSFAQRGSATVGRTSEIVAAAQKFLGTLDDAQRGKLVFDFNDAEQRKRWSNLPVGNVPRAGLRMEFGGHHLGLNITFAGESGTLAPSHTGAQPATYELQGKTVRPLGREVDKAFALYASFDEGQRKQATLGFEMRDLALGPGRDGQMIEPEGIKAANLTERQREMLVDLVAEWTGIMHTAAATAKLEEVKRDVAETWFAWSGPAEQGGAAYFRVHGPTVFIEFAPQRLGGDPTNHLHTIYRDPTNEYGAKWWKP